MVLPFASDVQNEGRANERRGQSEQGAREHPLNQLVMLLNTGDVHGSPQWTIEFIWRIGMRIEKATKAITAPISTIIIGSSRAVSAPMRTLTLDS